MLIACWLMMSCWSIGVPYSSGPDEPSHQSRSWSLVHGDLLGEKPPDAGGTRLVGVPSWLAAESNDTSCYRFAVNKPADCFSLSPSNEIVSSPTNGAQLPFFYAVSGIPFLAADRGLGLVLVRIWAALIASAFVASAVVTARNSRWGNWITPSVLIACPPMFFYIASVNNPSGIELAAALLLWVSGVALVCDVKLQPRIFSKFALSAAALILSRQLGPLWFLVISAFLLALAGRHRFIFLSKIRRFRIASVYIFASGVLWAVWMLAAKPLAVVPDKFGSSLPPIEILKLQLGRLWEVGQQSVGVFGWLDVRLPLLVYLIWIFGTFLWVALAVLSGKGWIAWLPLLLFGTAIVLQTLGEYRTIRQLGFMWQGRYTLPLLMGVPISAALVAARAWPTGKISQRAVWLGGSLIWVGLCLAFFQTERRYMVGAAGPLRIWSSSSWSPHLPVLLLLLVFALASGLWVFLCVTAGSLVGAESNRSEFVISRDEEEPSVEVS